VIVGGSVSASGGTTAIFLWLGFASAKLVNHVPATAKNNSAKMNDATGNAFFIPARLCDIPFPKPE
jgi:hypothetical protein